MCVYVLPARWSAPGLLQNNLVEKVRAGFLVVLCIDVSRRACAATGVEQDPRDGTARGEKRQNG